MSSLPQKHYEETRDLIKKVDPLKIANWLLRDGYFPEQYVLPPCFNVENFDLLKQPYYKITKNTPPPIFEIENISFPKSQLTDRVFGVIEPTIYHDIIWHLIQDWKSILTHLFPKDINIFSYSFPIPLNKKGKGQIGRLRSGRMIYEFLEMAENDLVAEAHNFKYLLRTDIKNFYPSIYTHSLAWALHGKIAARNDRNKFLLLGSKLDKLFQNANDGRTNGIPIGPVISDLASELLLSQIDLECSQILKKKKVKFLGVRFKDDYRFLCNSKDDASKIMKTLQSQMRIYNLSLGEGKSEVMELPEGLYRGWTSEYHLYSLKYKKSINYKVFETTLLAVLRIDQRFPDTGIVDKFLSELTTKKYKLKLALKKNEILKTFSLLILLKQRRPRAFPQILATIELIFEKYKKYTSSKKLIVGGITQALRNVGADDAYDGLWLLYFLRSIGIAKKAVKVTKNSLLVKSITSNSQKFFKTKKTTKIKLFKKIQSPGKNKKLVEHLAVFSK